MLKTFNSSGLDNLALGYLPQFFLIDSKNLKKKKQFKSHTKNIYIDLCNSLNSLKLLYHFT